ncbi:MAG TPA: DUF916 domain-containing protein [Actinoplanes sp.]|nr:DUF916 domain-containing protein [Actinoplanes sp.]
MRTRIAAAVLALATLASPAPARADSLTWSVAPSGPQGPNGRPAFDYKLDPGATVTDHVAVTNHSRRPLTLRLYAQDAFTTSGGGFDLRAGAAAPVDAGGWITVGGERITLPASSRVVVPFTLTVPANATPGDHAAGIVASLLSDTADAAGNRVSVDHRVGSRVYLRVTGPLRQELTVTGVQINTRTSWNPSRLPDVTATFTVVNNGNVRLGGTPTIRIAGPFGFGARTATAATMPEILPGGSLTTTVTVGSVPPLGRENLIVDLSPAPADGRAADPAPAPVSARHTVWLMPWPQLAVLAPAAGLLALWWSGRRRRERRMRAALAAAEQRGRDQARIPDDDSPSPESDRGRLPEEGNR